MKKTSAGYNKNKYIILAIILYIIIIIVDIVCIKGIFMILDSSNKEVLSNIRIIPLVLISIMLTIAIIGGIIGTIKGYIHNIFTNNKSIKNDIYLRELPNDFGIGVTTLLFDSKIENKKDIVAVILDLCARKYLSLTKINNKYNIKVLKNIDNNLYDNEKYIMELLINDNIKNIDYYKWYRLCEEDGINRGLYSRYEAKSKKNSIPKNNIDSIIKLVKIIALVISIIFSVITIIINSLFPGIFMGIFLGICVYFGIFIIIFIPVYLIETIKVLAITFKNMGHTAIEGSYNNVMSNNLIRTDYGENEYQKLVSFKNFIKDFGEFASREAKEVVIWDRYLSYAQVFGLTKEIMQTGYKELIANASFQIDNIDNITLDNIEVLI